MRRLKIVAVICLIFLAITSLSYAQAISPEAEEKLLKEASDELVCLCGCGNMILSTCTCGQAGEWRTFLRGHIRQGKNKEQLLEIMAQKHGPQVLAAPAKEGLNWVLWVVVPYIVPLIGAVVLGFFLLKWVKKKKQITQDGELPIDTQKDAAKDQAQEQYEKRMEDELKKFDE